MTSIGMFEAKAHFAQFAAEIVPTWSSSSGLKFGLEKGKWGLDDKAFDAADADVAEMFA